MDDLSAKITELLSDPQGLEKVKTLANGLLSNSKAQEAKQETTVSASALPFDPSQISGMISVMNALKSTNQKDENTALLLSLKPHLSSQRRKKVDTAIAIMRIIKILPLLKESGLMNLFGE